ncbi:MAG: Single-stranded DNA-binding protein [Candidatus Gottesmanbacteria bacterium GW2011_GWC2_39_8]|uniref:Single-stranded DNA-binding protein n=1 Tax=Candidatus Gottesmanbacteria bacterium GW2011_GWC2_39_8 TaxID=1618450 RepID=A0A0G0Q3B7_9BACT|nr:MAG: Single-stranded DNA-binding protein [Candidatus Gottesmanbacteria bacterium GW2011_GWC2_39_8]
MGDPVRRDEGSCSQLLTKGRKVYVEGRLSTRSWTAQDNTQRTTTEVVIEDMIILDSKRPVSTSAVPAVQAQPAGPVTAVEPVEPKAEVTAEETETKKSKKKAEKEEAAEVKAPSEDISPDDIPF